MGTEGICPLYFCKIFHSFSIRARGAHYAYLIVLSPLDLKLFRRPFRYVIKSFTVQLPSFNFVRYIHPSSEIIHELVNFWLSRGFKEWVWAKYLWYGSSKFFSDSKKYENKGPGVMGVLGLSSKSKDIFRSKSAAFYSFCLIWKIEKL